MQETRDGFLGWEDPPEKGMATHSSILAWRISWTEEPGGPMGLQRVRHEWATNTFFSVHSPQASDLSAQGSVIRFPWSTLTAKVTKYSSKSGSQACMHTDITYRASKTVDAWVPRPRIPHLPALVTVWVSGFFKTSLLYEYPRLRVTVLKTIITNSSCNKSQRQKTHFSPFLAEKVS